MPSAELKSFSYKQNFLVSNFLESVPQKKFNNSGAQVIQWYSISSSYSLSISLSLSSFHPLSYISIKNILLKFIIFFMI